MTTRKMLLSIIIIALMMVTLVSCIRTPLYWVTSSGILTYNKNTGQLEVLWDYKGHSDTLRLDSLPQ